MAPYTVEQYLLDRAFAEDTTTKLWRVMDLKLPVPEIASKLAGEVFASQITIDYSKLMGDEAYIIAGEEQAKKWAELMSKLDKTIHSLGPLLTDLPVPDGSVERPIKLAASSTGMVALNRQDKVAKNGAVLEIELVRTEAKGNPWRVSSLRVAHTVFKSGDNIW